MYNRDCFLLPAAEQTKGICYYFTLFQSFFYLVFIKKLFPNLDIFLWCKTQAFLVGKDFGARIVYLYALFHPERVAGVVTLGIPFLPPTPVTFLQQLPEGFYIARWQVYKSLMLTCSFICIHSFKKIGMLQFCVRMEIFS